MKIIAGYKLSSQQKAIFISASESKAQPCAGCIIEVESSASSELVRALRRVIDEQEILRTTLLFRGGLKFPLQEVKDGADCIWFENDLSDLSPALESSEIEKIFRDRISRSFDLGAESPLQAGLIRLSETRSLLIVVIAGLCADATTVTNLLRSLALAYGSSREQANEEESTVIQYVDYAGWQGELLTADNEQTQQGKTYWTDKHLESIKLPEVRDEPRDDVFVHGSATVNLDRVVQDRITALAEETETSERAVLLACWLLLIRRLANQQEVCAGYVASGRDDYLRSAFGVYARRLPLCFDVNLNSSFRSLTSEISSLIKEVEAWQEYFMPDPKMAAGSPCEFEYLEYEVGKSSFKLSRLYSCLGELSLKLFCSRTENQLSVELYYNSSRTDEAGAGRLASYYQTLLAAATLNPELPARKLSLLDDLSYAELLSYASGPKRLGTSGFCIHELIEAQALTTPNRVAVVSEAGVYTYSQLNARSNQIAHYLRAEHGVGPDEPVGLLCGRSLHWVAGMLGILKAGGAYVPLDEDAPLQHLRAQIKAAGLRLVVSEDAVLAKLSVGDIPVPLLNGELASLQRYPETSPPCHTDPENLCYVMLTSGSTGAPKAVCITHSALVNYSQNIIDLLELNETGSDGLSFGVVSTLNADLCNTMIFPGLLKGHTLHLMSREVVTDAGKYSDYLQSHKIDAIKIVPSHFAALLQRETSLPQKYLIFGGEALGRQLVSRVQSLDSSWLLINHYGPTETTVGTIVHKIERTQVSKTELDRIPIGKPIANTEAYVLDEGMELAPVGVTGELYLGGAGVARGYLGRAELTAAAFVPHPFSEAAGARLYRTGDVVRYRVGGELEYVGRVDEQVKIRGYRIEPGEVEVVLGEHERVRAAAVVVSEQGGVGKRLEAYVEAEPGQEISVAELGAYLGERLPAYMVPGRIEVLRSLPLTENGKVDRRRLREQGGSDARRSRYRGPESEAEEQLARIWGEVLKLERVGIDDNFFELGGDSILSIQVVARAKEAGLQLTPREVFQHPTIARLAGRAGAVAAEVSVGQGLVSGAVPLTPIQRWFFAQEHQNPHHWNQAVVLRVRAEVRAGELEEGLNLLLLHHDALRLRFRQQAGEWEQENEGAGERLKLARHDLAGLSEEQQRATLKAAAEQLQAGLNISNGPLVAGSVFELGGGERRLVLVIHHLVVDGVSWRILLEDLQSICRQLRRGEAVRLPAKTTSYKEWAERLVTYAQSAELAAEQSYWVEKSEQRYGKVPVDHAGGENNVGSGAEVTTELSAAETQALLQAVPGAYRCSINEALLWSLVRTLRGWTGADTVRVELESHGREELWEAVDVTRTVGWFTTRTLVQVSVAAGTSNEAGLKQVKAELRGMKRQGLGYGVLRYLSGGEVAQQLGASGEAEVSFNYLGQLDQAVGTEALLELSGEELGSPQDERNQRSNLIQLNSRVSGGQLRVSWNYSRNLHERESIEAVARQYQESLRELIRGASEERPGAYTASDFPLLRVREEELERVLQGRAGVENLYRLSGVQQGMIFHTLYAPGTGMYVGQLTCRVEGELSEAAFAEAWQRVVGKHEVLRSSYEWEGVSELLAVVQKAVTVEVELVDWREVEPQGEQLERYLEEDRRRGFDLRQAPLMRVKLLRLAEREWQIVWTNHHIILDGWCRPIVLNDFFSFYQAIVKGKSPSTETSRPYRDYIEWLEQQDKEGARQYWQQRLAGFARRSQLRIDGGAGSRAAVGQSSRKQQRELSAAVTKQLVEYGRAHGLTMNTLVQGAWAIVLGEYSRQQDLVYGAVVSGRPAELVGVETMVGLFINTVPVRVKLETDKALVDWLQEHQAAQVEMMQYEYTSLGQIQSWAQVPASEPLFETLFVFENFPSLIQIPQDSKVAFSDLRAFDQNNYPLTLTVIPRESFICELTYSPDRFDEQDIKMMLSDLTNVIERITSDPNVTFEQVETSLNKVPPHREQKKATEHAPAKPKSFRPVTPKAYDLIDRELVKADLHPGTSLPLVFTPADIKVNLIEWARSYKDFILASLSKHGAVLFRGFEIDPEVDFEPLALVLTTSLMSDNGEHNRESVRGSIYTPVFYSPSRMLLWHNENSFNYQWPMKIWFACATPASQGGEMLLADSRKIYELISPTIRDRFVERGITYVRNYRKELGLEWQKVFGTTKKEEVESYCRENQMQFEWKDENRLRTIATRPAIVRHPQTGEISWFNQAQHWHVACLDPETLRSLTAVFTPDEFPRNCYYGDGTEIDDATMYELCEVYKSIEVPVVWQRGDILLIDNVLTAHGRNPYVGNRKMFVAMGDMSKG